MKLIISIVFLLVISACSGTKWKSAKTISTIRNISSTNFEILDRDALPRVITWRGEGSAIKYKIPVDPMLKYSKKDRRGTHGDRMPGDNTTQNIIKYCNSEFLGTLQGTYVSDGISGGMGDTADGGYHLLRYEAPRYYNDGDKRKFSCKSGDLIILSAKQFKNLTKIKHSTNFEIIDKETLPSQFSWAMRGGGLSPYEAPLGSIIKYNFEDQYGSHGFFFPKDNTTQNITKYCNSELLGTLRKAYVSNNHTEAFRHYLLRYEAPNDGNKRKDSCKSGDLIILSAKQLKSLTKVK